MRSRANQSLMKWVLSISIIHGHTGRLNLEVTPYEQREPGEVRLQCSPTRETAATDRDLPGPPGTRRRPGRPAAPSASRRRNATPADSPTLPWRPRPCHVANVYPERSSTTAATGQRST